MKLSGFIIAVVVTLSGATTAFASHAGASFHDKTIKFSYPKGWSPASHKDAMSLGASLTGGNSHLRLVDAAGVKWSKTKNTGDVALVAKIGVDSTIKKELKGNHDAFMRGFVKGIANKAHVLGQGKARFAKQSGIWLDETQKSNGTKIRARFYVSIAKDDKAIYLGMFFTVPPSGWSSDSSKLISVAKSTSIK